MGRHHLLLLLLVAPACSRGFDRPLTPAELAPYQVCSVADDCQVVNNGPTGCCSLGNFGANVAAVAKNKVEEFRAAFEEPDCMPACPDIAYAGPDLDPQFIENKYPLSCTQGQCSLIIREHAGKQCGDMQPCPMDYACRTYEQFARPSTQSVCWYAGTP